MAFDCFSFCIDDLQLPGSPWLHVADSICKTLAYRIRLEGLTYQQLEKVSKFIGSSFMKKYHLYDLYSSFSSVSTVPNRLSKDVDCQKFLKELILKAADDCDCTLPVSSSSNPKFIECIDLVKAIYRQKVERNNAQVLKTESDIKQHFGQTIVTILKNDPGSLNKVKYRLNGQLLPPNLRSYIFRLQLINKKKSSYGSKIKSGLDSDYNASSHHKLRNEFATKLKSNKTEMKINNPIESQLSFIIYSSVSTAFESNIGLQSYADDKPIQKGCCNVLNILYTYRKQFENVYVFWCFPLLLTFSERKYDEEHTYDIAMWLNVLITEYIPSYTIVNQIVFSSWSKVLKHSKKILHQNELDLDSAMKQLDIATDNESVKSILTSLHKTKDSKQSYQTLHPVVVIRQWIVQLFVGYLQMPSTLYIWDQLFLNNWSHQCFSRICLVLVCTLGDKIRLCKTKADVVNLFSKGLNSLTLQDIRNSWKRVNELLQ